jgi:hypothetical protein
MEIFSPFSKETFFPPEILKRGDYTAVLAQMLEIWGNVG